MRVAFIRSVDIRQAQPWFSEATRALGDVGHDVALFLVDDRPEPPDLDIEVYTLARGAAAELAEKVLTWSPDRVVSISVPDDVALRDSVVCADLRSHGIDVVMHSPEQTATFADKWATRNALLAAGIPVADGFLISGDLISSRSAHYENYIDFLRHRLQKMEFPVLLKPVWGSMGEGIRPFHTVEEVVEYVVDGLDSDAICEQYVYGNLFGLEIQVIDGKAEIGPLIFKSFPGEMNFHPFEHVRCGPASLSRLNIGAWQRLSQSLRKKFSNPDFSGNLDLDIIGSPEAFYVLEVNPRVSGLNSLSSAISGRNVFSELATGEPARFSVPKFVIEVPILHPAPELLAVLEDDDDCLAVNVVTLHDGRESAKFLYSTAGDPGRTLAVVAGILLEYPGAFAADVLQEVRRLGASNLVSQP